MHRSSYAEGSVVNRKVNWGAIAGVVAGALVGNFVTWGIAAINAMIVAGVIYYVVDKVVYKGDPGVSLAE